MEKQAISPTNGAPPKGPYSPVITFGDLVFISGQGPVEPGSGEVKTGDVLEEFQLAMVNVTACLEAAGSSPARSVTMLTGLR